MRALLPLLLILALVTVAQPAEAQRDTPCRDRQPTASSAQVPAPDEPGQRMVITGRVLLGDDRVPVENARVLSFQTDAEGYYSVGGMDERNARLCGVLVTDSDGAFTIDTIRPAHYATGGPPAHVHFEVTLPGERMRRFTLNFEGDPELNGRQAGESWDTIRPVIKVDDVQYVERDFWLR